jgi:hypothetical protein
MSDLLHVARIPNYAGCPNKRNLRCPLWEIEFNFLTPSRFPLVHPAAETESVICHFYLIILLYVAFLAATSSDLLRLLFSWKTRPWERVLLVSAFIGNRNDVNVLQVKYIYLPRTETFFILFHAVFFQIDFCRDDRNASMFLFGDVHFS